MGAWEDYWSKQQDIRHRMTPDELMAIYGPTYQATPANDTGMAADWWNGQNKLYQGGLSYSGRLPWASLADNDQQAITDWFTANVLDPAKSEWGYDKNPDELLRTRANSRHNPFWWQVEGENILPDLWRRPETEVGLMLAGLPGAYGFSGAPDVITQIDMLARIDPAMAARYGITPEYAKSMTDQNVALQAQRRATHQKHLGMEGNAVLGAIGAIAGAGAMNALGGSPTSGLLAENSFDTGAMAKAVGYSVPESTGSSLGFLDTIKQFGSNMYDSVSGVFNPASAESADPLRDLLIKDGVLDPATGVAIDTGAFIDPTTGLRYAADGLGAGELAVDAGSGQGLFGSVGKWITDNPTSALNIAKAGVGLLGGALGSKQGQVNGSGGNPANANPNFAPFTPNLYSYNWRV